MPVITISHQIGSGGREIGQAVATAMGLPYIDREIVQGVAQRLNISEDTAKLLDEHADHLVDQVFGAFRYMPLEIGEMVEDIGLDTQTYQRTTQTVLEAVAAKGQVVIAGHGANFFLNKRTDVLSVFIYAPVETRIERVMQYENLNQADATKRVHKSDGERAHYIKTFYHVDWRDPNHYQLMINTAFAPYGLTASVIEQAARYCKDCP
ncbi:MAG: cytidylate kinase-like family protein [Chloroflexota bacterium]|nr:cytidylate kinase-like family protein [Chloroflexota bacterium]